MLSQLKHTELQSIEKVLEFFNEMPAHKLEGLTQTTTGEFNIFYRDYIPCEYHEAQEELEE